MKPVIGQTDMKPAPQTQRATWKQSFRALRHSNYRWYFVSGFGMAGALGIKQFALAWLVLDLTGSVGQLGLVVFMQGLPMTVVSMFGGVLADRYDRRQLLVYSQLLTMTNIAVLAALTIAGSVELWHIYVSSIVLGITQALTSPARQAYIASLVEKEDAMNAVALNSMQQHVGRILWPSLAGGLIVWLGVGGTLLVNSGCYLVGIVALLMIRDVEEQPNQRREPPLQQLAEGLRYSLSTPVVATVVVVTWALGLLGLPILQMAPGFARETLGMNAGEAGVFLMFMGVGAIVGSVMLTVVDFKNKPRIWLTGCALMALSLIALAANPWYLVAFVCIALFGMANSMQVIMSNTIFQTLVPSRLLGRVVSMWFLAGGLGSAAALPIGVIGDIYGLRVALGGAAAIMLVAVLWFGMIRQPAKKALAAAKASAAAEPVGPVNLSG